MDKNSNLDIERRRELRGRLDWKELEYEIYNRFARSVKSNIQTCLGCVSPIVTALTIFFNLVLVSNLINHITYIIHENVICKHFCNEFPGFGKPFLQQELEESRREWINFIDL